MIMEELGRHPSPDHGLITKYASAQEKYYKAKFGVYFKSARIPINTITIDEEGLIHGSLVAINYRVNQTGLQDFANRMKGLMKVHLVHVKTMKSPDIVDLN